MTHLLALAEFVADDQSKWDQTIAGGNAALWAILTAIGQFPIPGVNI